METNLNLLDKIKEAIDSVEDAKMYAAEWKKEATRRQKIVNSLIKTQKELDPNFDLEAFKASFTENALDTLIAVEATETPEAPSTEETAE